MSNAPTRMLGKLAMVAIVVAVAYGGPAVTGPLSATRDDLEQAYRVHDPNLAGHQRAEAVAVGPEGITVLASANPKGETDHTWLLRLGLDGAVAWQRHYEPAYGTGRALSRQRDGALVIAGDVRRGAMAYQGAVLRVDATGAVAEAVALGPRAATGFYAVQARGDGSVVAGGTAQWKGWLVSTDPALSHRREAAIDGDEINSLGVLTSGDIVALVSVEKSTSGFGMAELSAIAPDGAARWHTRLPSPGRGDPVAVVARAGGAMAIGNGALADRDPAQIWIAQVADGGKVAWQRSLGDAKAAWRARAAAALPDGGVAIAGEIAIAGVRTPQVWRLSGDGTVRWQHGYGDRHGEMVTGIAATSDGGMVMVGSTQQGRGKTNVWVVRLDPNGGMVWQHAFGAAAE